MGKEKRKDFECAIKKKADGEQPATRRKVELYLGRGFGKQGLPKSGLKGKFCSQSKKKGDSPVYLLVNT